MGKVGKVGKVGDDERGSRNSNKYRLQANLNFFFLCVSEWISEG